MATFGQSFAQTFQPGLQQGIRLFEITREQDQRQQALDMQKSEYMVKTLGQIMDMSTMYPEMKGPLLKAYAGQAKAMGFPIGDDLVNIIGKMGPEAADTLSNLIKTRAPDMAQMLQDPKVKYALHKDPIAVISHLTSEQRKIDEENIAKTVAEATAKTREPSFFPVGTQTPSEVSPSLLRAKSLEMLLQDFENNINKAVQANGRIGPSVKAMADSRVKEITAQIAQEKQAAFMQMIGPRAQKLMAPDAEGKPTMSKRDAYNQAAIDLAGELKIPVPAGVSGLGPSESAGRAPHYFTDSQGNQWVVPEPGAKAVPVAGAPAGTRGEEKIPTTPTSPAASLAKLFPGRTWDSLNDVEKGKVIDDSLAKTEALAKVRPMAYEEGRITNRMKHFGAFEAQRGQRIFDVVNGKDVTGLAATGQLEFDPDTMVSIPPGKAADLQLAFARRSSYVTFSKAIESEVGRADELLKRGLINQKEWQKRITGSSVLWEKINALNDHAMTSMRILTGAAPRSEMMLEVSQKAFGNISPGTAKEVIAQKRENFLTQMDEQAKALQYGLTAPKEARPEPPRPKTNTEPQVGPTIDRAKHFQEMYKY